MELETNLNSSGPQQICTSLGLCNQSSANKLQWYMLCVAYSTNEFKQDLSVIKKGLTDDNFDAINIFANRIMSNAFIMDSKKFVLPAFLIKDLTLFLVQLKQIPKIKSSASAKSALRLFISSIDNMTLNEEFKNEELWKAYHTSLGLLRKHLLPDNEKDSYDKENTEFTNQAFKMLITYVQTNQTFLKKQNNLLRSLLTEMNRIYQEYGMDEMDTKYRALFVAMNYIDEYVVRADLTDEKIKSEAEELLFPFVDKVFQLIHEPNSSNSEIDNLIVDMILFWRGLFLKYGELFLPIAQRQSGKRGRLNLPEETKEKISKLVTQGLEDQIKKAR